MVQEGNGSVSDVISLLDNEKSTSPSTQGSSSVERDLDSDDEEPVRGPNKRQDRRLSRATRLATKEGDGRSHDLTYRPKSSYLITAEKSSSTAEPGHRVPPVNVDDSEDEDWRHDGTRKGSESTSFSTSASDISVTGKPTSTGVRLKLSQPKEQGPRTKTPSSSGAERPAVVAKSKKSTYKGTARVCPHPGPPPRRLPPAKKRSFQSLKKAVVAESSKAVHGGLGHKPLMMMQGNERTPAIETHIKVLYI